LLETNHFSPPFEEKYSNPKIVGDTLENSNVKPKEGSIFRDSEVNINKVDLTLALIRVLNNLEGGLCPYLNGSYELGIQKRIVPLVLSWNPSLMIKKKRKRKIKEIGNIAKKKNEKGGHQIGR
jgi:hypothetical protein